MIEITVIREKSTDQSTAGEMFVNGEFVCYTLEDVERPVKVFGATAQRHIQRHCECVKPV